MTRNATTDHDKTCHAIAWCEHDENSWRAIAGVIRQCSAWARSVLLAQNHRTRKSAFAGLRNLTLDHSLWLPLSIAIFHRHFWTYRHSWLPRSSAAFKIGNNRKWQTAASERDGQKWHRESTTAASGWIWPSAVQWNNTNTTNNWWPRDFLN